MVHEIRAEKAEMDAIESGEQTAIVRANQNFAINDLLSLREYDPRTLKAMDRLFMLRITHMRLGDGPVLSPRYAVMSFQRIRDAA